MAGDDIQTRIRAQLKPQLPKRFYKIVNVCETPGGYGIELDGRGIKTKVKAALAVPARELAELIAAEWRDQGEFINPAAMPLSRIANSAIDLVAKNPEPVRGEILGYAASDLLCYRAASPRALIARQDELWSPILALAAQKLGAKFQTTASLVHLEQSKAALGAFENWLGGEGAFELAAEHTLTVLSGSALIAWALAADEISQQKAWRAAHVDEDWQIGQWGEDEEAKGRSEARYIEFKAAADFLSMVKS